MKKKAAMANITKKTSTKRKPRKGDGKGKSVGAENGERQDAEREKKQDEKRKERAEKQKKKEQKERERQEKEKEREALAQRDKLYLEKLQQIADGTFWGGENADRAGGQQDEDGSVSPSHDSDTDPFAGDLVKQATDLMTVTPPPPRPTVGGKRPRKQWAQKQPADLPVAPAPCMRCKELEEEIKSLQQQLEASTKESKSWLHYRILCNIYCFLRIQL